MAIITYPLNGIEYNAEDAETYLCTRTSGVFSAENNFSASVTGSRQVTISQGIAWIQNTERKGKSVVNTEPVGVEIPIADGVLPRKDRIVLRFDKAENKSKIILLKGDPSSQPKAPNIKRTESIYDLGLCVVDVPASSLTVNIGNITSTLLDESVCGLMRDGVTGIPTNQLQKQVEQLLKDLQSKIDDVDSGNFYTKQESDSKFETIVNVDKMSYMKRSIKLSSNTNYNLINHGGCFYVELLANTAGSPLADFPNLFTSGDFLHLPSTTGKLQIYAPLDRGFTGKDCYIVYRTSTDDNRYDKWRKIGYGLNGQDVGVFDSSNTVPIAKGGTGSRDPKIARANLGLMARTTVVTTQPDGSWTIGPIPEFANNKILAVCSAQNDVLIHLSVNYTSSSNGVISGKAYQSDDVPLASKPVRISFICGANWI